MGQINLYTTDRDFQELHEVADGKGQKTLISKKKLMKLLMDHSQMHKRLEEHGDQILHGKQQPTIKCKTPEATGPLL